MADTFTPPPLSAHEGPAQGFVPPPPIEDKPGVLQRVQQFSQEHPYISGAASLLVPGASAVLDPTGENAKGALKQAGRDAYGLVTGPGIGPIGMGAGYLANKTGLTDRVMKATEPSNDAQRFGGYATTAAELAIPMPKVLGAATDIIPNAERAGAKFQRVMAAAGPQQLDLTAASAPALRAHELGEAGATLPKVMNKFVQRTTAPDALPLTYREGRDFASNAGRLSVQESMQANPQMKAQVSALAKALGDANEAAAEKAGVGDLYREAMKEYQHAKQLGNAKDVALKIAKKAVLPAAGAGLVGVAAHEALR